MDVISPWIIVVVYGVDCLGLAYLGRTHGWRIKAMILIPLSVVLLYSYIGFAQPDIELARQLLRYVLLFSGGMGGYIIFDLISRSGGNSLRRRHDDR